MGRVGGSWEDLGGILGGFRGEVEGILWGFWGNLGVILGGSLGGRFARHAPGALLFY